MITWLQSTLQRHYKWLFSIMLVIIVVAFVFTIGASPGISASETHKKVKYFGYDIASQRTQQELASKASISNFIDTGQFVNNQALLQNLVFSRPALLNLADQLQIASPNEYELADFIKTKPIFKSPSGKFDAMKYENFLNSLKNNPALDQHMVRDTLAENFRIERAVNAVSGPGVILPFEAKLSVDRQNTLYSVDVATLSARNLPRASAMTEEDLKEYYEKLKFQYTEPAKLLLSYAKFNAVDFVKQVVNPTEEVLQDYYDMNVMKFTDGDYESQKKLVLRAYRKNAALRLAEKHANDFLYKLYENDVKFDTQKFHDLINEYSVGLKALPAFPVNSVLQGTSIPERLLRQSASLSESTFYSDIVSDENSAYILFFNERLPSAVPPIEAVAQRLKERYNDDQNARILDSKSKVLSQLFKQSLQEGQDFNRLARSEGMSVQSFNKFKLGTAPESLSRTLLEDIMILKEGDVSTPVQSDDSLQLVYLREKYVGPSDNTSTDSDQLLDQLQRLTAAASGQGYVSEMIERELKKSPLGK